MAGCQKRQMSITLATLTKKHARTHARTHTHTHTHTHKHTEKEINYEHKTTKKERKDSKITQCGAFKES